jgi:YVTN family beta-propeller protein
MNRFLAILCSFFFIAALAAARHGGGAQPAPPDRSPTDLALTPDGRMALTANNTANTVSLVELDGGRVVTEKPVGERPFAVAVSPDGRTAVVSNWGSNTVTLLNLAPAEFDVAATVPVGEEPRGVAFSRDGKRAFVALSGEDAVVAVDVASRKAAARLDVGVEPWHLDLSTDGKRLAGGSARSGDVTIIDVPTWKEAHAVKLRGKNVRHVACSPDGEWAYVLHNAERGRPTTKSDIDLGWIMGGRLSRAPLKEEGPREAIALDPRGKAVGDVDGLAVSPDGKALAITAAGTHEVLLLRQPLPFVAYGGPGDHIEPEVLNDTARFRRIAVGGRPLGAKFTPDGKRVVVANYLSNSVQVVDFETGAVAKTISLGGPAAPSLARQGEAIFYDATRSHHQWYSCGSCHTEGHTNGSTFDTFNDGSYNTPKKTLSLRGVAETGPWTWHGHQKSLNQIIRDSMTKSMQGPEPTEQEVDALAAYLGTLKFRPERPGATAEAKAAAKRGEAVFNAKGCQGCHAAPTYAGPGIHDVGLESVEDALKGFNPPSLRGVRNRQPYLHTGTVNTLEEVLTKHHRPSKLSGTPDLTPKELADLIVFLETL